MPTVHSLTSRIRPLGRGGRRLSGHPDAAAVTIILACGLLARAIVFFGAPVFIMKDSQSYFLPGWDLAHGLPFDLEQRRTPVYSWFVALVLTTLGDDLSRIALVQHLLGLGTALAVYWIGRLVFGRGIGFAAGLLTALSGPLLVFEHYVMPEALFAFLLAVGVGALLRGMTTGRLRWYALGGVILGVAALTRPAAQLILLGLPLVLLARRRSLRATIGPSLVALAGLAAVTMPWIAAVYADYGILSTGATVGEPLLFRTVHQDRGFRLPDRDLDPFGEPSRNEARRMVIDMSARRANPSAIVHQLRRDLKLSRSEADAALRDVALEMVREQPGYYLLSTARLTAVLFAGRHEALNLSWTTRRDRAGDDTLENWQSVRRIRHLVQPASPEQRAAYGRVERVVELFQPSRFSAFIGVLFLIGTLACVLRPEWRPGLLLSLTAAALILTCTLFSGAVWRFRYPADPFIQTVALAGAVAAFRAMRPVAGRLRSQLSERRRRAVAAPQARLRPS